MKKSIWSRAKHARIAGRPDGKATQHRKREKPQALQLWHNGSQKAGGQKEVKTNRKYKNKN